jgi:uncharacterized protein YlxW (UPF0749 family)
MLFGITDAALYTAIATAVAAIIPAALAYRRAMRTDSRTSDLDTLREIIKTLQQENADKNVSLAAMNKRIDQCEAEKDQLQQVVYELKLQVFHLKSRGDYA